MTNAGVPVSPQLGVDTEGTVPHAFLLGVGEVMMCSSGTVTLCTEFNTCLGCDLFCLHSPLLRLCSRWAWNMPSEAATLSKSSSLL